MHWQWRKRLTETLTSCVINVWLLPKIQETETKESDGCWLLLFGFQAKVIELHLWPITWKGAYQNFTVVPISWYTLWNVLKQAEFPWNSFKMAWTQWENLSYHCEIVHAMKKHPWLHCVKINCLFTEQRINYTHRLKRFWWGENMPWNFEFMEWNIKFMHSGEISFKVHYEVPQPPFWMKGHISDIIFMIFSLYAKAEWVYI